MPSVYDLKTLVTKGAAVIINFKDYSETDLKFFAENTKAPLTIKNCEGAPRLILEKLIELGRGFIILDFTS